MISIIGTRPQYIKVKPIYDYCKKNGIPHRIIDTSQHYSSAMSDDLIQELELEVEKLNIRGSELEFMAGCLTALDPDEPVLVYGDTNTTFCAALVCYKKGIPFGHVEAGSRTGNIKVPEEVNRIFADTVATHNFCLSEKHLPNAPNTLFAGDLEYELLNQIDPVVRHSNYGLMTIHRQSNMNKQRIEEILEFCSTLPLQILLLLHHRLAQQDFWDTLPKPDNLTVLPPFPYYRMVTAMAECYFLISDSGGLQKSSPFFGKRIVVLRGETGIPETIEAGYANLEMDAEWLMGRVERDKSFYLGPGAELIVNTMLNQKTN